MSHERAQIVSTESIQIPGQRRPVRRTAESPATVDITSSTATTACHRWIWNTHCST